MIQNFKKGNIVYSYSKYHNEPVRLIITGTEEPPTCRILGNSTSWDECKEMLFATEHEAIEALVAELQADLELANEKAVVLNAANQSAIRKILDKTWK